MAKKIRDHQKFVVWGPFKIRTASRSHQRYVDCAGFWESPDLRDLAGCKGCYAFGVRAGRGINLKYIGKAAKTTFRSECFVPHKLGLYKKALKSRNGTPVMFLVVATRPRRGAVSTARIDALERFLIQTAVSKGIDLLNERRRGEEDWIIGGVVRAERGRPIGPARKLRSALRL